MIGAVAFAVVVAALCFATLAAVGRAIGWPLGRVVHWFVVHPDLDPTERREFRRLERAMQELDRAEAHRDRMALVAESHDHPVTVVSATAEHRRLRSVLCLWLPDGRRLVLSLYRSGEGWRIARLADAGRMIARVDWDELRGWVVDVATPVARARVRGFMLDIEREAVEPAS